MVYFGTEVRGPGIHHLCRLLQHTPYISIHVAIVGRAVRVARPSTLSDIGNHSGTSKGCQA